jgi:hypothetical protein
MLKFNKNLDLKSNSKGFKSQDTENLELESFEIQKKLLRLKQRLECQGKKEIKWQSADTEKGSKLKYSKTIKTRQTINSKI